MDYLTPSEYTPPPLEIQANLYSICDLLSADQDSTTGELREIGSRHGKTPGEVAIAWTLRHPAVTAAIVGLRSPAQLDGVIGAAEWRLTEGEVADIAGFMATPPG